MEEAAGPGHDGGGCDFHGGGTWMLLNCEMHKRSVHVHV